MVHHFPMRGLVTVPPVGNDGETARLLSSWGVSIITFSDCTFLCLTFISGGTYNSVATLYNTLLHQTKWLSLPISMRLVALGWLM